MTTKPLALVKLVFCGPDDVAKEIAIGKNVVETWNQLHGEARGLCIKPHHWRTDTYPDLSDRAQNVVNRQLIDKSKILVAIFWSRFGTPTGAANSGTQEEILRAADRRQKVMVYFSGREPIPADADTGQLELLWQFRQALRSRGICWNFSSRDELRRLFEGHLALALNAFEPSAPPPRTARETRPNVSQKAKTKKGNIYQNVGNTYEFYDHPPSEKTVRERRPGSVTTEEVYQINEWIEDLAESEVGMSRSAAFRMWGSRFKSRFCLGHREDLLSAQMLDAKAWHRTQKAIQNEGLKSKAPDLYRNRLIGTIKAGMAKMGLTNETYYPVLSRRLKMKKPITHLPDLTTTNLRRVRNAVRNDLQRFKNS